MKQVQLKDGRQAINLIPDYSGLLAVVSFSVLQRLSRLLPEASAFEIILTMIEKLKMLRSDDISNKDALIAYVQLLEDEVAFHKSVNLITTIKPEDLEPEVSKAGKYFAEYMDDADKLTKFVKNEHIDDVKDIFTMIDKYYGDNISHVLGNALWNRGLHAQGWGMEEASPSGVQG